MILDFLRSFRDYCYNETKNSKDESYAESNHKVLFGLGFFFYYFTILPPLCVVFFMNTAYQIYSGRLQRPTPIFPNGRTGIQNSIVVNVTAEAVSNDPIFY